MAEGFFQNRALKLHNKLVHECSRDVLDKEVVRVPPRKVDIKDQGQRVTHKDFVLVHLGHVDIQSLAWVGFRRAESDALDSTRCLHGTHYLFAVFWKKVMLHRHGINEKYNFNLKKPVYKWQKAAILVTMILILTIRLTTTTTIKKSTEPGRSSLARRQDHGGEQHEMREQRGLPDTSYEETPLLRRVGSISDLQKEGAIIRKMKKAVDMIKGKFPNVDFEIIKIRRGTKGNAGKNCCHRTQRWRVQDFER